MLVSSSLLPPPLTTCSYFSSSSSALLPLCCRLWFLRPLKDLATLTERQEAIAFFSKQCNQEVMGNLADCLRNIKNLPVRKGEGSKGEGKEREWESDGVQ